MEKRRFEDSFKDAFNEAEVGPSDNVWTNIELELEKEAGDKIRRKLFFYKMLAAASITFALLVTSVGIFVNKKSELALQEMTSRVSEQSENKTISSEEILSAPIETLSANRQHDHTAGASKSETKQALKPRLSERNQSPALAIEGANHKEVPKTAVIIDSPGLINGSQAVAQNSNQRNDQKNSITPEGAADFAAPSNSTANHTVRSSALLITGNSSTDNLLNEPALATLKYNDRQLPHLYVPKAPSIAFKKPQADPVAVMMARLALEESVLAMEDKKDKESKSEKIWTSVGFAAGGFNSVNHSVASPPPAANSLVYYAPSAATSAADKQSKASGVAYSMGLSFGTKLSKRWILQSGINYLTQSSDYVATNVVADNNYSTLKAESINSLGKIPLLADASSSDQKLAPTVPYSVNNNVKFFSVPVQAGYLIVNRKFGVQLNAGLSSDFFLQNTITPQSGSLDKTTQGSGDNSPYRSLNFSGLMGTEFTYRLGQRYRIALNPGVRYPLNSVYKSDVGVQSTPVTFDVGLRFRYIFQ
ncbi:MAG: outer membrane beta-barrel protein [Chryseolinea sp.]